MSQEWKMQLTAEDLEEPYSTLVAKFGLETTVEIIDLFQGQQIYFPKLENACDVRRRELIREEFDGYNYKELAKKYKLTTRWVRKICEDLVQKEKSKPFVNQINMFE